MAAPTSTDMSWESLLDSITGGLTPVQAAALAMQTSGTNPMLAVGPTDPMASSAGANIDQALVSFLLAQPELAAQLAASIGLTAEQLAAGGDAGYSAAAAGPVATATAGAGAKRASPGAGTSTSAAKRRKAGGTAADEAAAASYTDYGAGYGAGGASSSAAVGAGSAAAGGGRAHPAGVSSLYATHSHPQLQHEDPRLGGSFNGAYGAHMFAVSSGLTAGGSQHGGADAGAAGSASDGGTGMARGPLVGYGLNPPGVARGQAGAIAAAVSAPGVPDSSSGTRKSGRERRAIDKELPDAWEGPQPSGARKTGHSGKAKATAVAASDSSGSGAYAVEYGTSSSGAAASGAGRRPAPRAAVEADGSAAGAGSSNAGAGASRAASSSSHGKPSSSSSVDDDLRVHKEGPASLHNKKMVWTPQEDEALRQVVAVIESQTLPGKPLPWNRIDREGLMPGRNSKQCRDRWVQHLRSDIIKTPWSEAEDALLYAQIEVHGTAWSEIAKAFPGRTDHDIKNHFYATKRRLARRQQKEREGGPGMGAADVGVLAGLSSSSGSVGAAGAGMAFHSVMGMGQG